VILFPLRKLSVFSFLSKKREYIHAVDDVSFQIRRGEIFCLVGESGSGKSTIAKSIVGLIKPTSGELIFDGIDLNHLSKQEKRTFRHQIQMIFQDPYESLNPHMTIFDIVIEPLLVNNLLPSIEETRILVSNVLNSVELTPPDTFFNKYAHQLSGGQRQRVAIAAALILQPKLLIADEPISMLDASVRSEVLKLMIDLKQKRDLTYLFITHDLAIAKQISDRIAVMYLGKILEIADARKIIKTPLNPYTKALISVIPLPKPKSSKKKILLKGEIPSATDIPSGCRFHTRCPIAEKKCSQKEPLLRKILPNHFSACHFAEHLK
jgi:peptide/nickel transport system ATP-binding protein